MPFNPAASALKKKDVAMGIFKPHSNDVLSGRGNFVNYHDGNSRFRAIVKKYKLDYVSCAKTEKPKYAQMVVNEIYSLKPPGRFLKQDETTKLWYTISPKKAVNKARQALREGAPGIKKVISTDGQGPYLNKNVEKDETKEKHIPDFPPKCETPDIEGEDHSSPLGNNSSEGNVESKKEIDLEHFHHHNGVLSCEVDLRLSNSKTIDRQRAFLKLEENCHYLKEFSADEEESCLWNAPSRLDAKFSFMKTNNFSRMLDDSLFNMRRSCDSFENLIRDDTLYSNVSIGDIMENMEYPINQGGDAFVYVHGSYDEVLMESFLSSQSADKLADDYDKLVGQVTS